MWHMSVLPLARRGYVIRVWTGFIDLAMTLVINVRHCTVWVLLPTNPT